MECLDRVYAKRHRAYRGGVRHAHKRDRRRYNRIWYTKIESVEKKLNVSRQTASRYLKICEKLEAFKCVKFGRINYFVNLKLFEILQRGLVL